MDRFNELKIGEHMSKYVIGDVCLVRTYAHKILWRSPVYSWSKIKYVSSDYVLIDVMKDMHWIFLNV